MSAARRPQDQPRNPFVGGRRLMPNDVRAFREHQRLARMRLALETIAKLEAAFDDPLDAARAAVAIAKEALK